MTILEYLALKSNVTTGTVEDILHSIGVRYPDPVNEAAQMTIEAVKHTDQIQSVTKVTDSITTQRHEVLHAIRDADAVVQQEDTQVHPSASDVPTTLNTN